MTQKPERFRAYLDESEDSSAGVYVVGGFVGEAEVWDRLEPEWQASLPTGITSLHATDCFTGNNDFQGMSISRRMELLDKVTDIIVNHEIRLIGCSIDAKVYKTLAPKAKENEFLRNKYAAPFGEAVQLACEGMGNGPTPENVWKILDEGEHWEQCAFFIESNEYSASANRTIAEIRNSRDLWFRSRIGTETSGTKSGPGAIPLLQVADLGAFLISKHICNAPEGKISWKPMYEKLKNAGRIYRMVRADERSLKLLHQTHEELKKEAAEARSYWDDI